MDSVAQVMSLYLKAFAALLSEDEFSERVYLDFPGGKVVSVGVWCSRNSDGKMAMNGETHTFYDEPLTIVYKDQLKRTKEEDND